jgi:translocation and assembly module TamB
MAGGVATADGNITLKEFHDIPTSIRVNLENVSLNVPDKVRTTGSADLILSGKWFPFLMSGTYRVSNGIFEREFTEETGNGSTSRQSVYLPKILRQSAFEPLIFDIQILFERSFLVKNSMVEGAMQGNLQVKGSLSNPILLGRLQADKSTKLTFKDKVFNVQNGTIQFNSLDEINPELYVSATSRISDYDINLLAQGPAKNLRDIRLTSVPPLSEQDIVSLLALGVTSTRMDQAVGSREQAAQTGYELGFAIFSQTVNKQFQDRLGLNVQFTSSFDSTRNISVPKMTVSRKISNKVNASLSRSLGSEQSNEMKLQYLINQNVSAIGSYQDTSNPSSQGLATGEASRLNIFGLDLEFKKEFK